MPLSTEDLRRTAAKAWAEARPDAPEPTIRLFEALLEQNPGAPIAMFHRARALDFSGRADLALPFYEAAFDAGLDGDELRRAFTGRGSTLRNLGRMEESVEILGEGHWRFPDDVMIRCHLALAMHSAGRSAAALALMLDLAVERVDDPDVTAGARALRNYAAALRNGYWTPDGGAAR
jgi:tetratricopeptide (TPR) repeat protein